jgi:hypothetical protein
MGQIDCARSSLAFREEREQRVDHGLAVSVFSRRSTVTVTVILNVTVGEGRTTGCHGAIRHWTNV